MIIWQRKKQQKREATNKFINQYAKLYKRKEKSSWKPKKLKETHVRHPLDDDSDDELSAIKSK